MPLKDFTKSDLMPVAIAAGAFVLILGGAGLVGYLHDAKIERAEKARAEKIVTDRNNYIEEAKMAVSAQLRDPSSAQFSEIKTSPIAVCGKVNGKNGFGGYAGAHRFLYVQGAPPLVESEETERAFPQMWAEVYCHEATG